MKKVGLIMGSDSDLPIVQKAVDILNKYSFQDFIVHLKYIHYIKINNSRGAGEFPLKTRKLLD